MEQKDALIQAVGAISEMALIFYRAAIGAGATNQEAFELTKAYLWASIHGPKREEGGACE